MSTELFFSHAETTRFKRENKKIRTQFQPAIQWEKVYQPTIDEIYNWIEDNDVTRCAITFTDKSVYSGSTIFGVPVISSEMLYFFPDSKIHFIDSPLLIFNPGIWIETLGFNPQIRVITNTSSPQKE